MTSALPNFESARFAPGLKVAVIGAGVSGVCSAAHLLRLGAQVTVFERSGVPGGIWHLDEHLCDDPPYPSESPSRGDCNLTVQSLPGYLTPPPDGKASQALNLDYHSRVAVSPIEFSPPGPAYRGLTNNVPTSLMITSLEPWLPGTPENTERQNIEAYIQAIANNHGVSHVSIYKTRVDEVRKSKSGNKWLVRTVTMTGDKDSGYQLDGTVHEFDAVVVATGHYSMPRIPNLAGLANWKEKFGSRILHSKQYRTPEMFRGKKVLVIGAGVSSLDICRELAGIALRTYQSSRGGAFDLPASFLPENSERIPGIAEFAMNFSENHEYQVLGGNKPIPGQTILQDGRVLTDVDYVVVATGYLHSYPFLLHLHSDNTISTQAGPKLIVTAEGDMTHNLHKDIFYIEDPTLCFVGVPYYTATFSLFDFQAQVVARVLTGSARLPGREEMRYEYEDRLKKKGYGRQFHSLARPGDEIGYVNDLADWVNRDAIGSDLPPMDRHSNEWVTIYWEVKEKMKQMRAVTVIGRTSSEF